MESKVLVGYNQLLTAVRVAEHEEFNLSLFEDFNRLIEAIILYDNIVFLGDYKIPDSGFLNTLQQSGAFDTLSQEEIIDLVGTSQIVQANFERSLGQIFGDSALKREDLSASNLVSLRHSPGSFAQIITDLYFDQVIAHNKEGRFDVAGFENWLNKLAEPPKQPYLDTNIHYFARSLVYAAIAESQGMDYAPDMLRTPLAAIAFSRKPDFLSKQIYDTMVDKFRAETEALRLLGMPSQVFIPPLTALVLAKSPGPNNYASEILELRNKFAPYRKTYREFNELVESPDVTIKKKLQAKKLLDDSIKQVINQGSSDHALNVQTVFDSLVNADWGKDGMSATLSIAGALSIILKQAQKMRVRGKAKAIFDLWTDTKNLKNYGGLIEKTFKAQIDPNQVDLLSNYSSAIRSIIRIKSGDLA